MTHMASRPTHELYDHMSRAHVSVAAQVPSLLTSRPGGPTTPGTRKDVDELGILFACDMLW